MRAVKTQIAISTFLMLAAATGLAAQDTKDGGKPAAPPVELGPATRPNLADKPAADKEKEGKPTIGDAGAASVAPAMAPVDPNSYKIGAEDVLFIRVWKE